MTMTIEGLKNYVSMRLSSVEEILPLCTVSVGFHRGEKYILQEIAQILDEEFKED